MVLRSHLLVDDGSGHRSGQEREDDEDDVRHKL